MLNTIIINPKRNKKPNKIKIMLNNTFPKSSILNNKAKTVIEDEIITQINTISRNSYILFLNFCSKIISIFVREKIFSMTIVSKTRTDEKEIAILIISKINYAHPF